MLSFMVAEYSHITIGEKVNALTSKAGQSSRLSCYVSIIVNTRKVLLSRLADWLTLANGKECQFDQKRKTLTFQ